MANQERAKELAEQILPLVGGKENVTSAFHCMTRLRLKLKDFSKADQDAIKALKGVSGVVEQGGQLQIIIGTTVDAVYDEFVKIAGVSAEKAIDENLDAPKEKVIDRVFAFLSGTMTQIIPIMVAGSLCKTVVAVFGPQLLNVMPETSDLYTLFTFMGDAAFYFLPIFIAAFAAKQLNVSRAIAMLLAAMMMHPTLVQLATDAAADPSVSFTCFGIPVALQSYASTVLPILLVVWIMSYVERFFKRISPDVLKVVLVPFGTYLVMTPLALCVLGPAGGFIGNFICEGIVALNNIAGPLAVAIVGATFALLVMTGMHNLLFVYLFTTFPMLGYDSFLLPGILASSWVGTGTAIGYVLSCKDVDERNEIISFIGTWFFGGVGEPLLYGLTARNKRVMVASIAGGAITGLVAGVLHLTAYVLNTSNGMYGLTAFLGGSTFNYIALAITIAVGLASGIVLTLVLPKSWDAEAKDAKGVSQAKAA